MINVYCMPQTSVTDGFNLFNLTFDSNSPLSTASFNSIHKQIYTADTTHYFY